MGFIIIIITFLFVLCGSVSVYIVDVHMWRSGDKELVLAFHHVSLRDQTQAIRLGGRHLPILHLWYFQGTVLGQFPKFSWVPICVVTVTSPKPRDRKAKPNSTASATPSIT